MDGSEQLLQGIRVVLYGSLTSVDAETDDLVKITFTELPVGNYAFRIVQLMHLSQWPCCSRSCPMPLSSAPLHRLCGVAYQFSGEPEEGSRWMALDNVRIRITLIGTENYWMYTQMNMGTTSNSIYLMDRARLSNYCKAIPSHMNYTILSSQERVRQAYKTSEVILLDSIDQFQ